MALGGAYARIGAHAEQVEVDREALVLRPRAEAIRQRELERAMSRNGLAESEREAVEALTRSIVNKILHAPISRLREELEREEGLAHLEAARALFALDDPDAPGADADPSDEPPDRTGECDDA